jgi:hypothetical protein
MDFGYDAAIRSHGKHTLPITRQLVSLRLSNKPHALRNIISGHSSNANHG